MMFRTLVACMAVWTLISPAYRPELSASEPEPQARTEFFRTRIEPVLRQHCYQCHSDQSNTSEASLRLDSPAGLRQGGDSGPVIDSSNPRSSLLLQALRHQAGLSMPPDQPQLPPQVIADFEKWLTDGASDPRPQDANSPQPSTTAASSLQQARKHWAFQPIARPIPPSVAEPELTRSAIDAFLLKELESRDWRFAAAASRAQWLRRVHFAVTGLPPSETELVGFLSDVRPDAEQRLVDRLLASPRYGERLGQIWLDVVRYAESEGYEYDRHLPDAWRYRDWVIHALNQDKPFDQFVTEQVAGDELEPPSHDSLTAAVFHRLGPVRRNAGNPEIALSRNEVLTERTDILGAAFLGMTIGCARCHNHKLEPLTQRDYYQLQAYLAATDEHNVSLASTEEQTRWEAETTRLKSEIQRLQNQAKKVDEPEKTELNQRIEELDRQLPAPLATIPTIRNDWDKTTPIHILRRGVWEHKGAAVSPQPPAILVSQVSPVQARTSGGSDSRRPRTQLAAWLVDQRNPLTARVIVNRVWQSHFSTGIVRTANDFGLHGEAPSHPELIDWLSASLLEHSWEIKPLQRAILLSHVYRQSNLPEDRTAQQALDPDNRFLSSFPRRRLSAEEIRDAMLQVSGQLNTQMAGPSVMLPVDEELVQLLYKPSQWVVARDAADQARRSVYLFAKRNLRLPLLENLDAPTLLSSCARRESSTHAPQALELMNGWQANQLAQAFGERLAQAGITSRDQGIERGFWAALGRPPQPSEIELSRAFLEQQPLSEFALALFNMNEFLYVP